MLPDNGEVMAPVALMMLLDARVGARTTEAGDPVPLAEQDRSQWDHSLIAEGTSLLNRAIALGPVGQYQLPAAIAAIHDRAASHYRLEAVRAYLLEMAADPEAALEHYRMAASRTTNLPEQHYLTTHAAPPHIA